MGRADLLDKINKLKAVTDCYWILAAQQEDIFGYIPPRIDVSIFLLDEADTISWANQDFSLTPDNITFQAITLQNNSNNEDLFRYIDNLNPSARYFLWAVTG